MAKRKRRFEVIERPNLGGMGRSGWIVRSESVDEIPFLEQIKIDALVEQYYVDEFSGYGVSRQ